MTERN